MLIRRVVQPACIAVRSTAGRMARVSRLVGRVAGYNVGVRSGTETESSSDG